MTFARGGRPRCVDAGMWKFAGVGQSDPGAGEERGPRYSVRRRPATPLALPHRASWPLLFAAVVASASRAAWLRLVKRGGGRDLGGDPAWAECGLLSLPGGGLLTRFRDRAADAESEVLDVVGGLVQERRDVVVVERVDDLPALAVPDDEA